MKRAAVCSFLIVALAAQASAVLRPLYPVKPTPPFRGEVIVTREGLALNTTEQPAKITGVACGTTLAVNDVSLANVPLSR